MVYSARVVRDGPTETVILLQPGSEYMGFNGYRTKQPAGERKWRHAVSDQPTAPWHLERYSWDQL